MKRKKLNNEGFSFIEVLIALSILVVVSIPILVSINHSMKLNTQSKTKQRAVSVEQSITEKLGTLNVPEVIDRFRQTDTSKFDIARDFKSYSGLDSADTPKTYNIKDALANYYFGIYGIKEGAKEYDARITYKNMGEVSGVEEVNNKEIPGMVMMGSESEVKGDTMTVVNKLYHSGTAEKQTIDITMDLNKMVVKTTLDATQDTKVFDNVEYGKVKNIYVFITPVNNDASQNEVCLNLKKNRSFGDWVNFIIVKIDNNNAGIIDGGNLCVKVKDKDGMEDNSWSYYVRLISNVTNNTLDVIGYPIGREYIPHLGEIKNYTTKKRNRMYEVTVDVYEQTDAKDFSGKKVSSMTSTIIN